MGGMDDDSSGGERGGRAQRPRDKNRAGASGRDGRDRQAAGKRHGQIARPSGGRSGGGRSQNPGGRPGGAGRGKPASTGRRRSEDDESVQLYGLHAVEAALQNVNRVNTALHLTDNAERRIADAVAASGLDVQRVSPRDLDKRLGADTVHQGALLEAEPLAEPGLDEMIAAAGDGPLVILDQVTDPHNVGAVLRSAAVFGASGLVMTRRNSPPLDGTLAKSASGALELVPVHLAANLSRTLSALIDGGLQVIGLEGTAQTALSAMPFDRPTAFVFGAEGKGLRQLTMETCSALCRIETADKLRSLNVSNAAAVTLHTAFVKRGGRGG